MFSMDDPQRLQGFGFKFGRGGPHAARSMMLPELKRLLAAVDAGAGCDSYRSAVIGDNILGKPTTKARQLTSRYLIDLYALNPETCLFRVFRQLWASGEEGRPVLTLLLALARDALFRVSVPVILDANVGTVVKREAMQEHYRQWSDGRFSVLSLEAIAQRVNGSWTQAGYLAGKVNKVRSKPVVTPVIVTFALFLGYLEGRLAQRLFSSDWVKVLALPEEQTIELTQAAAQRGLLVFRRTGGVMEVRFPDYLTRQEQEWLDEQA